MSTIAEKLTEIAGNTPLVYKSGYEKGLEDGGDYEQGVEDGKQAEYDRFWNAFQQNGTRTDYSYAFARVWTDDMFKPKYKLNSVTNLTSAFISNASLTKLSYDASDRIMASGTCRQGFYLASRLTEIEPTIDASASTANDTFNNTFYSCTALRKVTLKTNPVVTSNNYLQNTFNSCTALEELYFEGADTISANIDLHWSPLLMVGSLRSILTALNKSISGKTLTLNTASEAVIQGDTEATSAYNAALTAGWTIAFA